MKKIAIFSLTMMLMLVLSTGAFAADNNLGPELGVKEGYVSLESAPEISLGARKWVKENAYGQYAVGGEIDYNNYWGSLGVYGTATYDYTQWMVEYFNPGEIFTKHDVKARSIWGVGYEFGDYTGFDWEWAQEFTYPVSKDIDAALKLGEGIGISASMKF